MATIGGNLRKLRLEKGLWQEHVAEAVGCSRFAIANYEADRRIPTMIMLRRFAEFFNVTVDNLTSTETEDNEETLLLAAENVFSDDTISDEHKNEILIAIMRSYYNNRDKKGGHL